MKIKARAGEVPFFCSSPRIANTEEWGHVFTFSRIFDKFEQN